MEEESDKDVVPKTTYIKNVQDQLRRQTVTDLVSIVNNRFVHEYTLKRGGDRSNHVCTLVHRGRLEHCIRISLRLRE